MSHRGLDQVNHEEAGRYWNESAESWTKLARRGFDVYRNYFNTPAFFAMLPDVSGLVGLDVGCGEGYNTRLLAERGARITAVDISEVFIGYAREAEKEEPLGVTYQIASAVDLPFDDDSFDFATGFMSFMDVPETDRVLAEAYRVIKPGAFLQFSITHPCFDTPHRRNLRGADGLTYAIEVGKYFEGHQGAVDEWLFKAAPAHEKLGLRKFRIPRFSLTISQWLNLIIATGFLIERVEEPRPSDEYVKEHRELQDAQVVSYFLHFRLRKEQA